MYQKVSKTKVIGPLLIGIMYFSLFLFADAQETREGTNSIEESVEVSPSRQNPEPGQIRNEVRTNIEARQEERASSTEVRQDKRSNTLEVRQENRASTTEGRQENRVQAQENRVELQTERRASIQEVRQQRVINLSANISNRMEAAIARITDIITRFEVRIDKMSEVGLETNEAKAKLAEAKTSIASAKATLGNIDNLVFSATTSEKPVSDWQNLREIYLETGRQIRQSHQQLREVIALLKQSVRTGVSVEASATATTSSNGI